MKIGLTCAAVNDELAAKLESELSMEKDMRDSDSMPSHLKEYLDNSAFKVWLRNRDRSMH